MEVSMSFRFRNLAQSLNVKTIVAALMMAANAYGVECVQTTETTQDCTVFLACEDNSHAEAGFLFQRKDGVDGDFADLLPVSGIDQCSYADILTGDIGGIVYTWRAFAFGLDGAISEPSNEATFTTPSIPVTEPPI